MFAHLILMLYILSFCSLSTTIISIQTILAIPLLKLPLKRPLFHSWNVASRYDEQHHCNPRHLHETSTGYEPNQEEAHQP